MVAIISLVSSAHEGVWVTLLGFRYKLMNVSLAESVRNEKGLTNIIK